MVRPFCNITSCSTALPSGVFRLYSVRCAIFCAINPSFLFFERKFLIRHVNIIFGKNTLLKFSTMFCSQRKPQVLKLDPPNELKFKGPFNDVVTSHLHLTNPSDGRVCFKIKTTAPMRYCVRPNSGVIESNTTTDVSFLLWQPFDSDPSELLKHKFMIQTLRAPKICGDLESLWKDAKASDLMDSKMTCVFEMPSKSPAPEVDNGQVGGSTETVSELQEENKQLQSLVAELKLENEQLKLENEQLKARGGEPDEAAIAYGEI